MDSGPGVESPRRRALEFCVPLALLAGRILTSPGLALATDWIVVVSLVWMILVLRPRSAIRPYVVGGAAVFLLGVYLVRQLPFILEELLHL